MSNETTQRQKARLENWLLKRFPEDAPDCLRFGGKVYGHPQFTDGSYIRTSRVVEVNFEERWARTKDMDYELGRTLDEVLEELLEKDRTAGVGS